MASKKRNDNVPCGVLFTRLIKAKVRTLGQDAGCFMCYLSCPYELS